MSNARFAVAALIAPLSALALFIPIAVGGNGTGFHLVLLFGIPLTYIIFCVIGIPIIFLLRKLGAFFTPVVLACGALAGIFCFFGFLQVFAKVLGSSFAFSFIQAVWGAVLGGIVALAFCVIAGVPWRFSRINRV